MELLCCNCLAKAAVTDWKVIISSLGAVFVGSLAIIISYFLSKKTLNARKREEEIKGISQKLNEFYGPLLQLRMKSNKIYQIFSKKHRAKDEHFATLTYLLKGTKFTGDDDALLKEIISIGKQCEELIHNKAGLIDDSKLRTEILPRATTHFLLLRLAHAGTLSGTDLEMYKDLTFPRELDELLEKRKKELEDMLNKLNKPE